MHDLLQEMANEAEVEDIHMIEDVANVDVLREIVELDRQGQPQELIREGARMTILHSYCHELGRVDSADIAHLRVKREEVKVE